LHTETPDGAVVPIWEEVKDEDVMVLKDIMASRKNEDGVQLQYARIPITAEKSPDFSDINELIGVAHRVSRDTPIVVNCQLGRGRSTLASVSLIKCRSWPKLTCVGYPSLDQTMVGGARPSDSTNISQHL
jgi:protein-tyrosine phosphatase